MESSSHLLFSSPFCWNSNQFCDFVNTSHNFIDEKPDDLDIAKFQKSTDEDAMCENSCLWYPENNWADLLGDQHFKLVTTAHFIKKRTKKVSKSQQNEDVQIESALGLLRIIRNKMKHNSLYDDEEKEILGWFQKVDGKWQFDKYLYYCYWSDKVPQLVTFLWEKFKCFRGKCSTLQVFYPQFLEPYSLNLYFGLSDFVKYFGKFLHDNKNQGMLQARYSIGTEPTIFSLEFITDSVELLQPILSGNFMAEILVSDNVVEFKFHDKQGRGEVFKREMSPNQDKPYMSWDIDMSKCAIIIANRVSDVNLETIVEMLNNDSNYGNKIIVLTSKDDHFESKQLEEIQLFINAITNKVMINLSEKPILWEDLDEKIRETVLCEGKLMLQNKLVGLKDIHENYAIRSIILSQLKGNLLNKLLINEVPKLLTNCRMPTTPDIYLERRISKRVMLRPEQILHLGSKSDIFRFKGVQLNELKRLIIKDVRWKYVLHPPDVFMVHEDVQNFQLHQVSAYFNLHEFGQIGGDRFECDRSSYCKSEDIEPSSFKKFLSKCKNIKESDFLASLDETLETSKLICVADKPGMGKTQILANLAGKLAKNYATRLRLFYYMKQFVIALNEVMTVTSDQLTITDILNAITGLSCSNEFELIIITNWITFKNNTTRVEILFDGLDEVESEYRDIAKKALQVINNDLPSVRVWVTLRDHMLNEFRDIFDCLSLQLEPFTEEEQIDFLEQHWRKYWRKSKVEKVEPSSETLRKFARLCLNVPLTAEECEITGIPLQTRMIAEINETKLLEGDYNFNLNKNNTLVNLYEQMIERKLEIYLKDKNKLVNLKMNHYLSNLVRADMYRIHFYFAIKLLFSESTENTFRNLLLIEERNFEDICECVLEQGIIQSLNPLTFFHRTFSEFLVALFVYKVVQNQFPLVQESNIEFQHFLRNEVFSCSKTTSSLEDFRFPTLCHFLNALLVDYESKESPEFSLILCLTIDQPSILLHSAPLFYAAHRMEFTNLYPLMAKSFDHLTNLFFVSLKYGSYEFCKHLMKKVVGFEAHNLFNLQQKDERGLGVLHILFSGLPDHFQNICRRKESIVFPDLEKKKEFIRYVVSKDENLLEQKDGKGRTPLLWLLQCCWDNTKSFGASYRSSSDEENIDVTTESGLRKMRKLKEIRTMHSELDRRWAICMLEIFGFIVTELKPNLEATDHEKNTVFHVPEHLHFSDIVDAQKFLLLYFGAMKLFLEHGKSRNAINALNCDGRSALFTVISWINLANGKVAKCFKQLGADLNVKNEDGSTALHFMIKRGYNLEMIKELIDCGADISVTNSKGQTALHLAAENKYFNLVKMLIEEYQACLTSVDRAGQSVMDYETFPEIISYLIDKSDN